MRKFLMLSLLFSISSIVYPYEKKTQIYYCPMHPSYTSTKPGQCPICAMDLVLKEEENKEEMTHSKHIAGDSSRTIEVPSDLLRRFGIKTFKVIGREFIINLSLPGNVAYDKELYELLNEYKNAVSLNKTISENEKNSFKDLIESSLLKLKIYGISKDIAENMLSIGISALIAPSNTAYAYFYIDEKYIPLIKNGDTVMIKEQIKDKQFIAKILTIGGVVDEFRKVKIIVLIENSDMLFTPGMYLYGDFAINRGIKLLIPDDSYIENGDEDIVYIEKENGKYEIRKIKSGFSSDGYSEVISGLKAGEKIISPAFLIDSEARLKGKINDAVKIGKEETGENTIHIHKH